MLGAGFALVTIVMLLFIVFIWTCKSDKKLPDRGGDAEVKEAVIELAILLGFLETKTQFAERYGFVKFGKRTTGEKLLAWLSYFRVGRDNQRRGQDEVPFLQLNENAVPVAVKEKGLAVLLFLNDKVFVEHLEYNGLEDLRDRNLRLLLCCAFYNDPSCYRLWKQTERPIFSAVLVVSVSEYLRKFFAKKNYAEAAAAYDKQKRAFLYMSETVLECCNVEDFQKTQDLLSERYMATETKGDLSTKLLDFISECKAVTFFRNSACLQAVEQRWGSLWPNTPRFKFYLHMAFYCGYLAGYWTFLYIFNARPDWFDANNKALQRGLLGAIITVYQMCYFVEISYEFVHTHHRIRFSKADAGFFQNYISFMWRKQRSYLTISGLGAVNLLFCVMITASVLTRGHSATNLTEKPAPVSDGLLALIQYLIPHNGALMNWFLVLSDLLFFVGFILSCILLLRSFTHRPTFSPIIFTMKNTLGIFVYVFVILIAHWATYSASQYILWGDDGNLDIMAQLFRNGAWETFADLEDDHKKGKNCTRLADALGPYTEWQCYANNWIMRVLVFVYTLTASVILINILTAVLSSEFESVKREENWRRVWYKKTVEYEDKPFLPPPFTILGVFWIIGMLFVQELATYSCSRNCCFARVDYFHHFTNAAFGCCGRSRPRKPERWYFCIIGRAEMVPQHAVLAPQDVELYPEGPVPVHAASRLQAFEQQGLAAALEIILDGQAHPVLFDRESEQLLTAQYLDKCRKIRYRFLMARNNCDLDNEERRRLCEELSADPERSRRVWLLRTEPSDGVEDIWRVADRHVAENREDATHALWKNFPMMEVPEFLNPDEFARAEMIFERRVFRGQGI